MHNNAVSRKHHDSCAGQMAMLQSGGARNFFLVVQKFKNDSRSNGITSR